MAQALERLLSAAVERVGDGDPELGEGADPAGGPPRAGDRLGEGAASGGVTVGQGDAGLVDALDRADPADDLAAQHRVERDQDRQRGGGERDADGHEAAEHGVRGELAVAHAVGILDLAVAADVDQLALDRLIEAARDHRQTP